MKEKYSAVLLAQIAGWIGLHKFYLGKTTAGILYAVFFWTAIPAFLAVIDAICYLFMDREEFNARYNSVNTKVQVLKRFSKSESGKNPNIISDQKYSKLFEAKKLLDAGVLNEEDFAKIKTEILEG